MRDYARLTAHLSGEHRAEAPLSFAEVEAVLCDSLPASARRHQAWWANTETHSHAASWMKAGWRTSRVDMAGERLLFVREADRPVLSFPAEPDAVRGVEERMSAEFLGPVGITPASGLSPAARRLLEERREASAMTWEEAMVAVVNDVAADIRRTMFDWFAERDGGVVGVPSADLIREAREERGARSDER